MRPVNELYLFTFSCILFLWVIPSNAESILIRDGTNGYTDQNSSNWLFMRNTLDAATDNSVAVVEQFPDLATMLIFDALWLELQYPDTDNRQQLLSASEVESVLAFLETGRRVVLRGENQFFEDWNTQILALVGGEFAGGFGCTGGAIGGPIAHELTDNVGNLTVSACGEATGGTSLFTSANVVTLWGDGNVLSILESRIGTETVDPDNNQLFTNIANWTAASVPEPTSGLLLGVGLVVLSARLRRPWKPLTILSATAGCWGLNDARCDHSSRRFHVRVLGDGWRCASSGLRADRFWPHDVRYGDAPRVARCNGNHRLDVDRVDERRRRVHRDRVAIRDDFRGMRFCYEGLVPRFPVPGVRGFHWGRGKGRRPSSGRHRSGRSTNVDLHDRRLRFELNASRSHACILRLVYMALGSRDSTEHRTADLTGGSSPGQGHPRSGYG